MLKVVGTESAQEAVDGRSLLDEIRGTSREPSDQIEALVPLDGD